jgi:hypothetical protein
VFLNLSKEEQRTRFPRRIDLPDHNWKFSAADVRERRYWDDYQAAFSEMLSETSTEWAPWYVAPADRKWFARISVAAILANALIEIDPRYPTISDQARADLQDVKHKLEAQAPEGTLPDPFAAELDRQHHDGHPRATAGGTHRADEVRSDPVTASSEPRDSRAKARASALEP